MIPFRKYLPYLWIAVFVLGDIALYSSRAVYLDEPFYIALAKTPRNYGLFFKDLQWVFFGTFYPIFGGGSHPPAVAYYLAALYSLFGKFQEIPFRLFYSIFGLGAGFGFYGLARRRCKHPLGVTLLFLASPAFFVMAQTLMMDVPMLSFLLLGAHFYFDDTRPWRRAVSAILFSLAVLSGYTAVIPLSCLFVSAILTRQPRSRVLNLAVAPFALVLWVTTTTLYYGKSPLTPIVGYFASVHATAHNILATPSFLGGVTMVPWLFLALVRNSREYGSTKSLILIGLVAAVALSLFIDWRSAGYGLWYILMASSGIGLLVLFAKEAVRATRSNKDFIDLFLVLWFPVTLLFFVAVAQFISARYLLLALPPLYLMLFDQSTPKRIGVVVASTLVVSLLVATADYRFVNSYPAWVSSTIDPLQMQGFEVLGASESGLRFYLEERGIPTLSTSDLRAKGGDLIVRHSTLFKYDLAPSVEKTLMVLKTWELNDRFPIRTFSQEGGAGFHGSSLGIVPFVFSRAPYDRLEIAEVSPFVERPRFHGGP